jgi:hypothetical protein
LPAATAANKTSNGLPVSYFTSLPPLFHARFAFSDCRNRHVVPPSRARGLRQPENAKPLGVQPNGFCRIDGLSGCRSTNRQPETQLGATNPAKPVKIHPLFNPKTPQP